MEILHKRYSGEAFWIAPAQKTDSETKLKMARMPSPTSFNNFPLYWAINLTCISFILLRSANAIYSDEFAMVDMEPFLMAVEYALHGPLCWLKAILITQEWARIMIICEWKGCNVFRELMHEMGVPDERVSVVGYGEEFAEHDNSTDDDRLNNRRVDFTIF